MAYILRMIVAEIRVATRITHVADMDSTCSACVCRNRASIKATAKKMRLLKRNVAGTPRCAYSSLASGLISLTTGRNHVNMTRLMMDSRRKKAYDRQHNAWRKSVLWPSLPSNFFRRKNRGCSSNAVLPVNPPMLRISPEERPLLRSLRPRRSLWHHPSLPGQPSENPVCGL